MRSMKGKHEKWSTLMKKHRWWQTKRRKGNAREARFITSVMQAQLNRNVNGSECKKKLMFVEPESGRGGWFVCKGRNPIPVSLYRFLFRLARWICPNELRVFLFQDRGKKTTCLFFFLIFCLSFFFFHPLFFSFHFFLRIAKHWKSHLSRTFADVPNTCPTPTSIDSTKNHISFFSILFFFQ